MGCVFLRHCDQLPDSSLRLLATDLGTLVLLYLHGLSVMVL
jgi:hypothetical protein